MIQKKVCILGAAGVGKTSLTAQFVYSKFSDKYLSTMGVKINRKKVLLGDTQVNMMIWDIHGEEKFKKITSSYLRGAAGLILVADGTRPDTINTAKEVLERTQQDMGDIPYIWLLNKADLVDNWCLSDKHIHALEAMNQPIYRTSAKTGAHVETSFLKIAAMMLSL